MGLVVICVFNGILNDIYNTSRWPVSQVFVEHHRPDKR